VSRALTVNATRPGSKTVRQRGAAPEDLQEQLDAERELARTSRPLEIEEGVAPSAGASASAVGAA
jgi:hypothetical protein